MRYHHIEAVSIQQDHVIFKLTIHPESKNPMGAVLGGTLYTLADYAAGVVAATNGQLYVTQEGSLHFLANQRDGVVVAKAKVRHRGKKTCLVNVDVIGEDGKLLSTGNFTFYSIGMSADKLIDKSKI